MLLRAALYALALASLSVLAPGCASGGSDGPDTNTRHPDTGTVDAGDAGDGGDGGPKPDSGVDGGGMDAGPVCVDADGDGFGADCMGGPDCDDTNASVSPAGTEVCNGLDDDCDGTIDDGLDTPVFCGVGACRTSVPQCVGGAPGTCTPLAAGTETCNGLDDDCDSLTDEGFGGTTCGIGACARTVAACMGGMPPACVPGSPTAETCNGLDDDCNTVVDDALGNITCGRGACARSVPACTGGAPGTCVPGTPGTESCNGIDDNCDGVIDDGFGALTCGTGACQVTVPSCVMGTPMSCTPGVPHAETCNNLDDDCNGMIDDGFTALSCGVGACLRTAPACVSGVMGSCTAGTPAPTDTCGNGIDDNCNGSIDEGCSTCTPPGNTTCGTAIPYAIGSTIMGNNTCSAPDIAASCGNTGSGNDSTFTFTSTGSPTRYSITMTGPTTYDTVLHAHTSSACNTTDELQCVDDSGATYISTLTLDSPPSGTVYLVADSFSASTGNTYTLTSSSSTLNNETCASAIVIRANGVYTGTTAGHTNDYNPTCPLSTSAPDVVYSLTARTSGSITASLCGSSYDTVLAVGTTCGGEQAGCNDDSCGLQSSVTFTATAGTTYYLIVDGYATNAGAYTLTISGY